MKKNPDPVAQPDQGLDEAKTAVSAVLILVADADVGLLPLCGDPIAQLVPASEDRLVRHLSIGFSAVGGHDNEKAIGMVGKLGDEPPFLVRELRTWRALPGHRAVLKYGRELQRHYPPQRSLGAQMRLEKFSSAIDEHAAELKRLCGKTEHTVAAFHHMRPHVIERVR